MMACEYICDGCGKRQSANHVGHGQWHKPPSWYQRSDKDGPQDACSRECVDRVAAKSKKTSVVIPV